ncbi:MAG TPA: DUF6714 family protein [Steroidobacteraceae bacterium]|nr:DUF6714 family protein [Steroidobacteraceae bacterium]
MQILDEIRDAFANRLLPAQVVRNGAPDTDEYTDAEFFRGKRWDTVSAADWESYSAAVFGFSPEAFCYFLPGVFTAGIRENRPDLLVNSSLLMTLDRSNTPSSWDDFFAKRWPTLHARECRATQSWLLWLADVEPAVVDDQSLGRAFDTIDLLINQAGATPIAAQSPRK